MESEKREDQLLFYTYWLVPQSLGFALAHKQFPNINMVSRAHGSDLYEYAHNPPYIPFRKETFRSNNYIFTISEHGKNYIAKQYHLSKTSCEVRRLGINDPKFTNMPSSGVSFIIVSCSYMVEIKRLDVLVDGIGEFSRLEPTIAIEWHHIGDGPLREQIELRAKSNLNPSIKVVFHGHLDNKRVFEFYRQQPVDIFINVSRSEGLPVSIMEAQSYGIPTIAPAVGGIPEIVNDDNGILLETNPSSQNIAHAIKQFIEEKEKITSRRVLSKKMWQEHFNAEKNYTDFAQRLIELFG